MLVFIISGIISLTVMFVFYIIFSYFLNFKPVMSPYYKNIPTLGNNKNRFISSKVRSDYDIIIIGSGISSLVCGSILSKTGKKVLILEQHYIAGGCTHAFSAKNYNFDTGLHYVGNIKEIEDILDKITYPKINWDRFGNNNNNFVYDEIKIDDKSYLLKGENFIEELSNHFPDEEDNIRRYVLSTKQVSGYSLYFVTKVLKSRFLAWLVNKFLNKDLFKYVHMSALEHVSQFTKNDTLKCLLLGQFGNYGRLPSEENAFIHSGVFNHYIRGGWYPRGGTDNIAKCLIGCIVANNGTVLVGKKVKSVLSHGYNVTGVEMENGIRINSKCVISGVGMYNTYYNLLKNVKLNKRLTKEVDKIRENIKHVGMSNSVVNLFIGMNDSAKNLELVNHNIWCLDNENIINGTNETVFPIYPDEYLSKPLVMFIGFPCLKDINFYTKTENEYKSTGVILCLCNYKLFEQWENDKNDDYKFFKNQLIGKILEEGLYKHFPKTRGKVDYTDLGTPLTFNNFINSNRGEIYGMETNESRFKEDDWVLPRSPIENLYLTGQDIVTPGISGGVMSGVITAHVVSGYGDISDLILNRNLFN